MDPGTRQDPVEEQQPFAEDWQAKVERLQEAVCVLLMKNQTMRMSLLARSFAEEPASGRPDRSSHASVPALNQQ
jgi:hypothetical protein